MYLKHIKLMNYNVKWHTSDGVSGNGVGTGFVLEVFGLSGVGDLEDVIKVVIGSVADGLSATIGHQEGHQDPKLLVSICTISLLV